MYKLISIIMLMLMTSLSYANDIYVTQSGASLDLDITQDGQNNTVGDSSTASTSTGATTILDIDQLVIQMLLSIRLMVPLTLDRLTYKVIQMMLI